MLKTILKPFASLTLTVILLCFSMVLIYAGTLAQVDTDIWDVQHKYFHSFFTWLPLQDLVPRFVVRERYIGGSVPFPGGYVIGSLLLLNLLAAHAVRFKFSPKDLFLLPQAAIVGVALWAWQNDPKDWLMVAAMGVGLTFIVTLFLVHNKRAGVIVIHLGLILLLLGEGLTSGLAKESRMQIQEGGYANYSFDIRTPELAIVDRSNPEQDHHVVISKKRLKSGAVFDDKRLPFQMKIDDYFINSALVRPADPSQPTVTDQEGEWTAKAADSVPGVGDGAVNQPAAFVTLSRGGEKIGSYLLTTKALRPQKVLVDGKTYHVSLRFERLYKPFTITLNDFSFDRYTGTNVPRNYSSDVTLNDPRHNERRDVRIWMNHPLRYQGETYYQSGFDPDTETSTVLQVVRNPGATMPYIAIMIAMVGLIMHFGVNLVNFLSKRDLSGAELALGLVTLMGATILGAGAFVTAGVVGVLVFVIGVAASVAGIFVLRGNARAASSAASGARAATVNPPKLARGRRDLKDGRYELTPQSSFFTARVLVPAATLLVCGVYVLTNAIPRPVSAEYDLETFGKLPLSYEGRVQPFDSLARNALKVLRGKESAILVENKNGNKVETTIKPEQWLLDVMSRRPVSRQYKVFSIDDAGVKTVLGLPEKERFFSVDDLTPKIKELEALANEAVEQQKRAPRSLDAHQHALMDTASRWSLHTSIASLGGLHVVPPTGKGGDWLRLADFGPEQLRGEGGDKVAKAFIASVNAYGSNDPKAFNQQVAAYQRLVDDRPAAATGMTAFETWYNHLDAFTTAIAFYVLILVFTAISWVTGFKPLARAAFWVLVFALVLHTFGLGARIFISNRPPVTNLASAAIFVGWGIVIFAVGLELIFRNGVGSVLAAIAGVPTLMIAYRLSLDGDTMKVLQAVLDTNIWLATHVVTITLGYAATFLAGLVGIAYVVLGVFTRKLDDGEMKKTLSRMMYGITCFALLLSFVGTILGGIWADQSWGRFWGWDPKENGAILIVLANALFLHARWGGLVKERGMANIAIFGNIVTVWSFFGTNQLGVGLHSYGFMSAVVLNMVIFMGIMLFFIGCGLMPPDSWRSGHALQAEVIERAAVVKKGKGPA